MLADTHKHISNNIYEMINDNYGIKLNRENLLWGSIAPDILPQYKIHRHYQNESINYIVNEIVKLIFICCYFDLKSKDDPIMMKYFSKKIGIISHYLSDYVCLPHAERWTFVNNMIKHISYETKLNEYAKSYVFKNNTIKIDDIDIYQDKIINLKKLIKAYILNVTDQYALSKSFERDLDFAVSLNLKMTYFIIDTVAVYGEATSREFAFQF